MKKFIATIIGLSVIASAATATYVLTSPVAESIRENNQDQQILDLFRNASHSKNTASASVPTVSNLDLEESISACAELTTAQYDFSSAYQYEKDGFLCFTGEECTFTYSGFVRAGIDDLSEVEVRIDHKHQVITVYMPDVEILGEPTIDPESIDTIDERTGWFSDITVDEYSDFLEDCSNHAIDRAQENDILSEAQDNAEDIVRNTVTSVIAHTDVANYSINVLFGVTAPAEHDQPVVTADSDRYKA